MFTIEKTISWEMGHRLSLHQGKCYNIHGHSYRTTITFGSPSLDANGMVIDFYHFAKVKEFIDNNWDHALMLNIDDPLKDFLTVKGNLTRGLKYAIVPGEPSAENMARWLCEIASKLLAEFTLGKDRQILSVTVEETATSAATFVPEVVN